MKGDASKLLRYMDGSGTRFIIPVYQRNYDWKTENCRQLYDDLKKVVENNRESHFFGSIVSVGNPGGNAAELLIIDGQQRITTVSLLLLALVNLLKEGVMTDNQGNLAERVTNTYLLDPYQPEEKKVKLKPIKDDQEAFLKLFDTTEELDATSNVTRNYLYFYNRIQKELEDGSGLGADDLFHAVEALEVISISLDPQHDDAQLIFESLNSTGLDLSEGDKIRNFMLMDLDSSLQDDYYYRYWNKIEKDTGYNVSDFSRHYLTVKNGKTPSMKNIYSEFKVYVEKGKIEKKDVLEDMTKYAKYYNGLVKASVGDSKTDAVVKRLNVLDMTVSIPFFMAFLNYRDENQLSNDEVYEAFTTIETYIFRRLICSVPTNALNKIFAMLHRDTMRVKTDDAKYIEVLRYVLNSKGGSGRMPRDTEFLQGIEERDIYNMKSKNKMYIFDRLENKDTLEHTNVIEKMQEGDYTVEHIMPQTLSAHWKEELGDEYQRIYDTWINRIANLTLTAYNSKYSNKPFKDKRDVKDGFKDSHLHINSYLTECDKWTEAELKVRNGQMKNLFLELWKFPDSDFTPVVTVNENHSLDEDFDYKGKQIVSYTFLGTPYSASNWADMYQKIVKDFTDLDSAIIYRYAQNSSHSGIYGQFSTAEGDGFVKIADKLYLWVASSTMSKITNLKRLFEAYGLDESELVIEISSDTEEE